MYVVCGRSLFCGCCLLVYVMIVCVSVFFSLVVNYHLTAALAAWLPWQRWWWWGRLSWVGIVRDKSHFSGFAVCVALRVHIGM